LKRVPGRGQAELGPAKKQFIFRFAALDLAFIDQYPDY
jgi:hypothetical protein